MVEFIQKALARVRDVLGWAPDNIVGSAILITAVIVAWLLHTLALRLLLRLLTRRHSYMAGIVGGTRGPTLLAFVIVGLIIALPVAPFDNNLTPLIEHLLLVVAIVVLGWIAITATHIAAELYLQRFRIDTHDNVLARKHITQVRIMRRVVDTMLIFITIGGALMTFEPVRHYGVSLFASAGVAGLVVGLAARPVLSNLLAGIQLAVTQPIRIEDSVVVEGESGKVEEITSTYVVLRLWDGRRLIVPLTYFSEKPFQNLTREATSQIGAVLLPVDYATPVERVRAKAIEIVKASPLWDGKTAALQVVDAGETAMQLRVLASARSSGDTFDLRCEIREKLIDFLQRELPATLPRQRQINLTPPIPQTASARDT